MVHLVRPQFSKMFPLSSKFKLNDPLDSSLAIWTTTSFSRYVDELKLKSKFIAIEIPTQQFHQMHQPTHRHESVFEIYRVAQCILMKRQQWLCYLWLIIALLEHWCPGLQVWWTTEWLKDWLSCGVSSYSEYWSRSIIKVNWIHHFFREQSDVT